jgi:glycosyltransferase involved in cell wall biosynthesis
MAKKSLLLKKHPISVIPNVIDTEVFKPTDKYIAREILNLPKDVFLILSGSEMNSNSSKGFNLFEQVVKGLPKKVEGRRWGIVLIGENNEWDFANLSVFNKAYGMLDSISLGLLYSAADLFVNTSKVESFGMTAAESMACGTPVVAFDNSGLSSVIVDGVTGYLVPAFDCNKMTESIQNTILMDKQGLLVKFALESRNRAVKKWSPESVIPQYIEIYRKAISC